MKNICLNKKKVGMLLLKRTDTRVVGISKMRKSIYLLTTTPSSHTHIFHPLPITTPASCSPHPLATPIHSTNSPQLLSTLLTCANIKVWMTFARSGWNVWVWLVGMMSRRWMRLTTLFRHIINFVVVFHSFHSCHHYLGPLLDAEFEFACLSG